MKAIIGISTILVLAACATQKIKGDGEGQTLSSSKPEKLEAATIGYSWVSKDSMQSTVIDTAFITGNTMTLEVTYGGGCEKHMFKLEGSKSISKSLPPIRNIRLAHIAKADMCKALIKKTLRYDISEFAYKKEAGSEIFLNIEGYDGNIKYTFVTP